MQIYQTPIKKAEIVACPHGLRCGKKNYKRNDYLKNNERNVMVFNTLSNKDYLQKDEKIVL